MMPFDYDAFAAWMESRKYAHRTIVGARSNLRRLERDGAVERVIRDWVDE